MAQQDVYSEALNRRDTLRKELAELDQFITLYEKLFSVDEPAPHISQVATELAAEGFKAKRRNNPKAIADLAEKILTSANQPMQRGDLISAIEGMGVRIYSDDKPRYIGTILWRNLDRFENIEGRGYWLKGRHRPEFESLFK